METEAQAAYLLSGTARKEYIKAVQLYKSV